MSHSRFKFWKKAETLGVEENTGTPAQSLLLPTHDTYATTLLKDFVGCVKRKENPTVLDIGPVIGSNLEYFFNYGIKVYMDDLLAACTKPKYSILVDDKITLDETRFFSENFVYNKEYFDGLICWDVLNYLDPGLAKVFVERISVMMKPNSFVLGFFHVRKSGSPSPVHKFRVISDSVLEYVPLDMKMEIKKVYQSRDVNQLFSGYQSQRFCLLKNNIIEVLLKKQ